MDVGELQPRRWPLNIPVARQFSHLPAFHASHSGHVPAYSEQRSRRKRSLSLRKKARTSRAVAVAHASLPRMAVTARQHWAARPAVRSGLAGLSRRLRGRQAATFSLL